MYEYNGHIHRKVCLLKEANYGCGCYLVEEVMVMIDMEGMEDGEIEMLWQYFVKSMSRRFNIQGTLDLLDMHCQKRHTSLNHHSSNKASDGDATIATRLAVDRWLSMRTFSSID